MNPTRTRWLMLATTAMTSMIGGLAVAQTTAPSQGNVLEEITVTATRQSQSVNKAPISVSAVTQETLDRQGIKNVQDLARVAPGLAFRVTGGDRVPQIAVRGIAATGGSQTTGVYLDDTPLQKRGILGSPVTGSGTPLPALFDLERVEILKGPQGTLYGGSSEGGTVRFITPTPSLTTYSGLARAEISTTNEGGIGHDVGVAIGGPIIEDKLGFRASFRERRIAGYLDQVSRFDGSVVNDDSNKNDSRVFRATALWKPTDKLTVTPSVYFTSEVSADGDTIWLNIPTATTVATRYYTAAGALTTNPALAATTQLAHTYGPYNMYGPYRNGQVTNVGDNFAGTIPLKGLTSPKRTALRVWANNAQYDFDQFKVNLITSYTTDQSKGSSDLSFTETRSATGYMYVYNLPVFFTRIDYDNTRTSDAEELRFTSTGEGRLTWVAGLYRAQAEARSYAPSYWNWNDLARVTRGVSDVAVFRVPMLDPATNLTGIRDQRTLDTEYAAYADATYAITDKLKATAGLRYSQVEVGYYSENYGQATNTSVATRANGGIVSGESVEKPVTPKLGLSYQIDDEKMVYGNIAKGYRPGGINLPASVTLCADAFTQLGITATPIAYKSDSVWSYEGGIKARLFDRAQLNAAVYYIDWDTPQTTVTLPGCGNSYLINAGKAVSKGFDAQLNTRLGYGFSFVGSVAYTNAEQKEEVGLPTATKPVFVVKGDKLAVPEWAYSASLQYDYDLFSYPAYVRVDYQHASKYQRSAGPGSTSYAPDTYMADATDIASMRAAVTMKDVEVSLFVNNMFESQDLLSKGGGRSGCAVATGQACTTYSSYQPLFTATTFRPREIGMSLGYKF